MDVLSNRFLEHFSPEGRDYLISMMTQAEFPAGSYLFREGDPADGVRLVLKGEVEMVKMAGSAEKVLSSFKEGEYFGEVAVLDGQGRSTDARARVDSVTGTIPSAAVFAVLEREPVSITLGLFQNVLNQLRRTNDLYVKEVVHKEKLSLVGEMASSLMHDLRNPIAGIHLAADLITMSHEDTETVHCCDKIRLQCDRVVAMAGELLEFSRGESKLDLGKTDTTAFIRQFTNLNDDYMKSTGVRFSINSEPGPIEIDSMRLLRLVQNLMTNAVDALKGNPHGHIDIRANVQDGWFMLLVTDNGPGIPEQIRATLFEPFVTFGKKGGTGLGMAIARNVVVAHKGEITFRTQTGAGTQFVVQIPQFASVPEGLTPFDRPGLGEGFATQRRVDARMDGAGNK